MTGQDWRSINRAHWDEKVPLHIGPSGYDLDDLRAGAGGLNAIEEAELGSVAGQRVLHLQCHFGRDTLILAQRGATVVGLDFSAPAIDAARSLAAELGLAERARFVQADLYDACAAIPEPASFDRVFVTWGAITWLPDIFRWAEIVAFFLKPGGTLYLAEAHPAALVFDDAAAQADGRPGFPVLLTASRGAGGGARLHRRDGVGAQRDHLHLDPSAGRYRDRADQDRATAGLAARARLRHLAHVRAIGGRWNRAMAVA